LNSGFHPAADELGVRKKNEDMTRLLNIFIAPFLFLLCGSCSTRVTPETSKSVESAVWMGKKFRDNPENEGGNENLAYEPSQFRMPDAYSKGMAPVWMLDSSVAHTCLILIIAKDKGFNESNWVSFFHGIRSADIPLVKSRVFKLGSREYSRLLDSYSNESLLPYDDFRVKISGFEGIPLQTMRKEDSEQDADGNPH
jgi:hypothetical protein